MCLVPTLISIAFAVVIVVIVVLPLMALSQNGAFDSQSINEASNSTGGSGGGLISGLFSALFGAGISWTFLDCYAAINKRFVHFLMSFVDLAVCIRTWYHCHLYFYQTISLVYGHYYLWIPGIIKSYSYSQAYFIYYDTYEQTGTRPDFLACITASRRLMKGYKGKLFLLD